MGHPSQRSHERHTQSRASGGTRLTVTEAGPTPARPTVELYPEEWRDIDVEQTPEAATREYDQYVNFDASGLAQLRQHLLETFSDARSCESEFLTPAAAGEIDTARLEEYLEQLTEAYEVLQTMLRQAEAQLQADHQNQAEHVSQGDIQEHYDAFMRRYDSVVAEVEALNETLADTPQSVPNVLDQEDAVTDVPISIVPANDNRPQPEAVPEVDVLPESLPQTLAVFVTETHRLCTKYQHALSVWDTTFTGIRSEEVIIYLDEYQHSLDRLQQLYDVTHALDHDDDDQVSVSQLDIYQRIRHEVEVNIATLELVLTTCKTKVASAASSPDMPESRSQEPTLPDQHEVQQLIERIQQSATASAEEKQTAMTLLENYERLLKEGAEQSRLAVMHESLKSFIDGILDDHHVDDLQHEFTEKYQQLLKIPNLSPDQAETLRAIKAQFDRQVTMTPVNAESLQKTFANLMQYESDHQAELVRLFGMRLPVAGPQGVFGARSFREALELQLHDGRIKTNPEAKALLQKILKVVGFVPEEGLTADETVQLQQLATRLNQMIEISLAPEAYDVSDIAVTIAHQGEAGENTLTLELSNITIKPLPISVPMTQIMSSIRGAATTQLTAKPYSTPDELSEAVSRALTKITNRVTVVTVGEITLLLQNPQPDTEKLVEVDQPSPSPATNPVNDASVVSEVIDKSTIPETHETAAATEVSHTDSALDVPGNNTPDVPPEVDTSIDTVPEPKALSEVLATVSPDQSGQYMRHPKIEKLIQEWYGPVSVFEKKVERQATALEAKNYDWIESKTSEFKSMYEYLKGMSVRDIELLRHRNRDELRRTLSDLELKYEAFTSADGWYEMLLRMQDVLPYRETTTFADLWQRWCLYEEVKRRTGASS